MHHVHFLGLLIFVWILWVLARPTKSTPTGQDSAAYEAGFRAGARYGAFEDFDRRR